MARSSGASRVTSSAPPATQRSELQNSTTASSDSRSSALKDAIGAALLIVLTILIYLPALHGGLIMDDARHITRPELRSVHGLARIWFDLGATAQYYPWLHTAFWLQYKLWGDSVFGYHVLNVVLHGISAFLVVMIVRQLGLPGGWIAGLLYAVHPVCVNSVAWIAEQKSTMSAVFYLGAALTFLYFDQTRHRRQYLLAFALFMLALLSKTVTATLPAALLLVLWWKRGKLDTRRDVLPLAPWIVIGVAAGIFTALVERQLIGAEGPDFALTFLDRFLIAGRVTWFYFVKTIWPVNLMFIYPHWKIDPGSALQYLFPLSVIAVALTFLKIAKKNRGPLAAMLFFIGTLVPVLGFLNVYPFVFSYVSDHFQYLAMLGIIVPAAAFLGGRPRFSTYGSAAVLVILAFLSFRQASLYKDAVTLYSDNVNRNPDAWAAHHNLGVAILDEPGQLTAAIGHFRTALEIRPDAAEVHHDLAGALMRKPGGLPDAIAELRTVVRIKPDSALAHDDLGRQLSGIPGRLPEALAEFNTALRLDPNDAEAHANLGLCLLRVSGKLPDAMAQLETALKLNPDSVAARNGLGNAFTQQGRWPEAAEQFEAAVKLEPSAETYTNLGIALMNMARLQEASAQFDAALRMAPDYLDAQMNRGILLYRSGHLNEAIQEYETVLDRAPEYPEAEDNLGVALMAIPERSNEAMRHFEIALKQNPDSAEAHMNFAITLANAGRTGESIRQFETALHINPDFSEAHAYLGILLSKIPGRAAEAIPHLETALRIKPNPVAREILDRLRARN